jgi:hypothetical protein
LPRSGKSSAATPQDLVPNEDRSGPNAAFVSEAYNAVARAASLRRISLFRSKFEVQPQYFVSMNNENAPKPQYTGVFGDPHFDSDKGRATCRWTWGIKVRDKRKITLSIEVVYLIIYDRLTNSDPEQVIRYMHRVGRFASYPYFRAHVSQINWESGINLPILPTIAT